MMPGAGGQAGSHIRRTTNIHGTHHITIPDHDPLLFGTLSALVPDVATHFDLDKSTLPDKRFGT